MSFADLPPMGFLAAFEASARLGSFKAAAAELCLTPSAISQQIKSLEDALGVELFRRAGRAIALTPEGSEYAREVRQALADVTAAGRRLRRRASTPVLRLSTAPFVAYELLLPRISEFRRRFPNIELCVEATINLVDLETSDVDAALRIGGGPWPALVAHPIGTAQIAVVAAPKLAQQVKCPLDLRGQTVIDVRGQAHRAWRPLLRSLEVPDHALSYVAFETYFETMRAAEHGLGFALGLFPMTTAWVQSGRLSVPLAYRVGLPGYIALIHRPGDAARFPFVDIARWLAEQYAALPPLPEGRVGCE